MRITIICQWFPPEYAPIGVMLRELAQDLGASGRHEVTVITGFPNHPGGIVFPGYRKRLFSKVRMDRFTVVRCWLYTSSKKTVPRRLLNYMTFSVTSFLAAWKLAPQDALFVVSPPLSNGLIGMLLRRVKSQRYVFNVQDIYPDAAISAGIIRNRHLILLLRKLELAIYRKADRIVVISDGFQRNLVAKHVPVSKTLVIQNWLDTQEIVPQPKDNPFARQHGVVDKFVVMYSGTIGIISGAEIMLECARRLAVYHDIVFLFVGEGSVKEQIMRQAAEMKLGNMIFFPFQPRELLSQVQSTADVSVVTLRHNHGKSSVPSKILGYMAAARPVIASVDAESDSRSFLENADCAVWVRPEDPAVLSDAILALYQDRERCRRLGQNGRDFLVRFCERRAITGQYEQLFMSVQGALK